MLKRTLLFTSPVYLSMNLAIVEHFQLWFDVERRYLATPNSSS